MKCNYCKAPSVVRFQRTASVMRLGHRRSYTVTYQSCAGHEGCANWKANRALYPDATIERREIGGSWK